MARLLRASAIAMLIMSLAVAAVAGTDIPTIEAGRAFMRFDVCPSWSSNCRTVSGLPSGTSVSIVDLWATSASSISYLKNDRHQTVICAFNAGSRDTSADDQAALSSASGDYVAGMWWTERWLNIFSTTQYNTVKTVMSARLVTAVNKGCQGVLLKRLACDSDTSCKSRQTSGAEPASRRIQYAQWLVGEAHARNLAVGFEGAGEFVSSFAPTFDFASVVACKASSTCSTFAPVLSANKAVVLTEEASYSDQLCPAIASGSQGSTLFSGIGKQRNANGKWTACAAAGSAPAPPLQQLAAPQGSTTDAGQPPSTGDAQGPTADAGQQPSTGDAEGPTADAGQQPSTGDAQGPTADAGQQPSTGDAQGPTADAGQQVGAQGAAAEDPTSDAATDASTDAATDASTDTVTNTDQAPTTGAAATTTAVTTAAVTTTKAPTTTTRPPTTTASPRPKCHGNIRIGGKLFAELLENAAARLRLYEALRNDIARRLNILVKCVVIKSMRVGSLVMDYEITEEAEPDAATLVQDMGGLAKDSEWISDTAAVYAQEAPDDVASLSVLSSTAEAASEDTTEAPALENNAQVASLTGDASPAGSAVLALALSAFAFAVVA